VTARKNDPAILASLDKVMAEIHPRATPRQRDAIVAQVLGKLSDACRDEPVYAGLASNAEILVYDVKRVMADHPHLAIVAPSADDVLKAEVAAQAVKPENRLTRLRELQLADDDGRIAALAAVKPAKADDTDKRSALEKLADEQNSGVALSFEDVKAAKASAPDSDDALLTRARAETLKSKPNATAVEIRRTFDVMRDRRDRDAAEKARYDAEHAIKGAAGMSAADRLTRHRLAQAGK